MNELVLNIKQDPGVIDLNFDEIEKALDERLAEYKGAVFTEKSKTIAKKEVANLRKLKAEFEDARKSVKREWMKPYDAFEARMKQLTIKIDEPINLINEQIEEFERQRREARRVRIKEIYNDLIGDMSEYCEFGRIYEPKWENATTTEKMIKESISSAVESARTAVRTISGMQSEAVGKALDIYRESYDMAKSIDYINKYEQQRAEIMSREEERRRAEEKRKWQEEEERIHASERIAAEREAKIREQAELEAEQLRQEAAADPFQSDKTGGDEVLPFIQPDTRVVFYRIVASEEDIAAVDMALDSLGIYYERRNA